MKNVLRALSTSLLFASTACFAADRYVVVDKPAKVFDTPDATGYVTLNSKNKEVSIVPGMVFKSLELNNGWHTIEYSPGLRGYLSEMVVSTGKNIPKPGTYKISNLNGSTITTTCEGNVWKATANGKTLNGKALGNAVVFFSESGQPAYSLVDLGKGGVALSYDNEATEFF